jgi:3',5'-nucleoside bisphosphate phosphatase
MYADLHIHSCFSDGTYHPEELPRLARQHRLQAVALTDHDSTEGCATAEAACRQAGIEFIHGVELTAEQDRQEVHLLGYGIDPENPVMQDCLLTLQRSRQERIHHIVARLQALDIPLEAATIFRLANCRSPGRPHVGLALVSGGFCKGMDEAFDRFLKRDRPAWVPKHRIAAGQAIDLIHQAGGVAVAAHPGLSRLDDHMGALAAAGLDGLECYHSKHSPHQCERYLRLAQEHGLLVTGGSDCHGHNHKRPTMGTVKLPWEQLEVLLDRWRARGAASRRQDPRLSLDLAPTLS